MTKRNFVLIDRDTNRTIRTGVRSYNLSVMADGLNYRAGLEKYIVIGVG